MMPQCLAMAQLTWREAWRAGFMARQGAIALALAASPLLMGMGQGPSANGFIMALSFALNISMFACVSRTASLQAIDVRERTMPLVLTRPHGPYVYVWGRAIGMAAVYGSLVLVIAGLFTLEGLIYPQAVTAGRIAFEMRNAWAGLGYVLFASACSVVWRHTGVILALAVWTLGLKGLATLGTMSAAPAARAVSVVFFYLSPIEPRAASGLAAMRGEALAWVDWLWLALSAVDTLAVAISLLLLAGVAFAQRDARTEA